MTKKHTKKSSKSKASAKPQSITAEMIYDGLMQYIEPDLVSSKVALLDEKYAGETKAEKADRWAHYKQAFVAFDAAYEHFAAALKADVRQQKKTMRAAALKREAKEKKAAMKSIETAIDSLSES